MPNLTARQMLARLPVRMAEGGAVDTAPGVSAAYRAAMERGGQQTVNDYYANLRKDAEAYLANANAPRGVEAYNMLLQSGISTSDLINAGVGQAVLDKIFAVQAPIKQEQFITPAGMTSAYERSPDLAFESQRLTALGQDGRAILDKQGRDYIANLQQGGIDAAERAQMLEYATERGYSFDDLMKAGVDPNVLFTQPAAAAPPPPPPPPPPGSALAPPVFPQTQPTYIPPTVYQPLPTQPDIFAAGQPALDVAFRESSPRTAIPGMPGQFDYSPAAKLRPATGAGFTFTPPSVTSRPRSLLSPREIQAYGGMTSKSQQFAANRAAIDRSLRRLQAASPALSNPSAYALLRNRIMAQDFGDPQRVFDPKTGEVNLTTEEGQSFLKAVNALAAASPAEKAAAEKAATTSATAGTGELDVDQTDGSVIRGSGSSTQPGGYAAAINGGDKITYGGYDILQQAKGGLVKKSKGSAKDELARFANGGEADAELLRRQLENIDNTPTARTPERAPTPEQTESRAMLENLRSGFAQIPQTVMGYGRDVLQSEAPLAKVGADVSALGSGAVEGLKQDPAGFILDMLPVVGEIRSGRDAAKYSDLANEARAANDLDAAAMYEQMSTLAAAGATPLIGTAGRLGRRIAGAPDEAMMRIAGSNTPTAADDLAELTAKAPTEATPNLTRFLANSQVKEPVFHAAKADVKEFSPKYRTELSSMGFHFGTADQANFRTGQYDFDSKSPNIGKYYLNIENPLEVSHMASFAPDHLAEKMMDMDLLTEDAYDVLSAKNNYDAIATGDSLVKILKKNGYDGLKYKNEREGEGFSFVPFSPTQIKSAIGNEGTFDPTNPVITKAKGGAVTKNNVERMRNDNRKYL